MSPCVIRVFLGMPSPTCLVDKATAQSYVTDNLGQSHTGKDESKNSSSYLLFTLLLPFSMINLLSFHGGQPLERVYRVCSLMGLSYTYIARNNDGVSNKSCSSRLGGCLRRGQ